MAAFPLKFLGFYKAKRDFKSEPGFEGASRFQTGQLLQYQKTDSNIHGMMEVVHLTDWNTKDQLIWHVSTDELYDNWQEYLEPARL
jgi:hypothetical protein